MKAKNKAMVLAMVFLLLNLQTTLIFAAKKEVCKSGIRIDAAWSGNLENEIRRILKGDSIECVKTLKITAGTLTDADVLWMSNNMMNLENLSITKDAVFEGSDLPDYAFSNYSTQSKLSRLKKINIDTSGKEELIFGDYVFWGCTDLKEVNLPEAVEFGDYAFSRCTSLKVQSLPEVKKFGSDAFERCISLENICLPNAVEFGDFAFFECSSLATASLPKVVEFGDYAFFRCVNLKGIKVQKNVVFGKNAFAGCLK